MSWELESIEALFKEHDDFVVTREEGCLQAGHHGSKVKKQDRESAAVAHDD